MTGKPKLTNLEDINPPQTELTETKYLSKRSLQLYTTPSKTDRLDVPPMSPKELILDQSHTGLPKLLPKLEHLKLPYVREVGVKACIEKLADYLSCNDYKTNLNEFWFLDMIIDCLWKAQDEYQFPEEHQKVILEWVIYVFNLIRAPEYNLSRKMLFKLFKEATIIAEEYIQTGCSVVPLPDDLFSLNLDQEGEGAYSEYNSEESLSSDSSISLESSPENGSYLAIKFQNSVEYFELPNKTCPWIVDNECLSSSEETISEEDRPQNASEIEVLSNKTLIELVSEPEILDDEEFYKPDMSTPPRFVSSHTSDAESSSVSIDADIVEAEISEESGEAVWKDMPRYPIRKPLHTDVETESKKKIIEIAQDEDIVKAWYEYYLWEQKIQNMDDPNVGWVPDSSSSVRESNIWDDAETKKIKMEWINYIKNGKLKMQKGEETIFINTCALLAIKQFVFDYFYESFQYTLIRIAFRYPHHLMTQEIKDTWSVPKIFKSELKRPKAMKPKKEKMKKEKQPKKEKKPKPEKKEKSKDKSSKVTKSTKEGKEKKEKKEPVKVDKAEIAKRKREEQLLEEERRMEEENKRFMFPLSNAVTDKFFTEIFDNWLKVDKKKGKK